MAFPVGSRTTGTLITQSIWNSDIVDNLNYLKGLAGPVVIEDDVSLSSGKSFLADLIYAKDFVVHQSIRSMVVTFEDGIGQVDGVAGGGGNNKAGGGGQWIVFVDDDVNGSNSALNNKAEDGDGKDTSFNVSRNPYYRVEFCLPTVKACQEIFLGFRRTPSNSPPGSAENHAGLWLDNSTWFAGTSNGASASTTAVAQPTANVRHVLEIFVISATSVKFRIDGVLVATMTATLPTGDLEWTNFLYSEGTGGAAEHSYLTIGKIIAQENLA